MYKTYLVCITLPSPPNTALVYVHETTLFDIRTGGNTATLPLLQVNTHAIDDMLPLTIQKNLVSTLALLQHLSEIAVALSMYTIPNANTYFILLFFCLICFGFTAHYIRTAVTLFFLQNILIPCHSNLRTTICQNSSCFHSCISH